MKENITKRDWFRFFSPAVLGIILSFIGVIDSYSGLNSSGGWSFLGILILLPIIGILLVLDIFIKLIFTDKTLMIWLVEVLVLSLIYLLWIQNSWRKNKGNHFNIMPNLIGHLLLHFLSTTNFFYWLVSSPTKSYSAFRFVETPTDRAT